MTEYITQQGGSLEVEINKGDSWTTNVTVGKNLSGYTITAWIKYGSNTIPLTVTETDLAGGQFSLLLSATNSALINTLENELFVKWVYGTESRTFINGKFRVIQ